MIDSNVYDIQGNMDARKELTVSNCRAELFRWYTSQEQAGILRTKVQALTVGMLHSRDRPELMLHGAETNGFLRFVDTIVLPKHGHKLDRCGLWVDLIGSCSAIVDIIWHHKGVMKMAAPACQAFCDRLRANIRTMKAMNLPCRQKHHLAMEMGSRQIHITLPKQCALLWFVCFFAMEHFSKANFSACAKCKKAKLICGLFRLHRNGPPDLYGCWLDESENKDLKAWSASAHGSVFHARVLAVAAGEMRRRHVAAP